ncbi:putative reverse transcriptase domain-containing protein [Tanacetum coccineum]
MCLALRSPEHAPPSPIYIPFVPELVYPEFLPVDDEVFPAEEQPLPAADCHHLHQSTNGPIHAIAVTAMMSIRTHPSTPYRSSSEEVAEIVLPYLHPPPLPSPHPYSSPHYLRYPLHVITYITTTTLLSLHMLRESLEPRAARLDRENPHYLFMRQRYPDCGYPHRKMLAAEKQHIGGKAVIKTPKDIEEPQGQMTSYIDSMDLLRILHARATRVIPVAVLNVVMAVATVQSVKKWPQEEGPQEPRGQVHHRELPHLLPPTTPPPVKQTLLPPTSVTDAQPSGHDRARETYAMTWSDLKKKMTTKYCPRNEIKKIEVELWNLKVQGTDVVAYNQRFQELALLSDRMSQNETDKIKDMSMINDLAEKTTENKRKSEDASRYNQNQQPNKRQNIGRAYAAGNGDRRPYEGAKPRCPRVSEFFMETEVEINAGTRIKHHIGAPRPRSICFKDVTSFWHILPSRRLETSQRRSNCKMYQSSKIFSKYFPRTCQAFHLRKSEFHIDLLVPVLQPVARAPIDCPNRNERNWRSTSKPFRQRLYKTSSSHRDSSSMVKKKDRSIRCQVSPIEGFRRDVPRRLPFRTRYDIMNSKSCRLGFTNAPACVYGPHNDLQTLSGQIRNCLYMPYFDLIPRASKSSTQKRRALKIILELLKEEEFYAKYSQMLIFGFPRVHFHGHVIDNKGISCWNQPRSNPLKIGHLLRQPTGIPSVFREGNDVADALEQERTGTTRQLNGKSWNPPYGWNTYASMAGVGYLVMAICGLVLKHESPQIEVFQSIQVKPEHQRQSGLIGTTREYPFQCNLYTHERNGPSGEASEIVPEGSSNKA